MGERRSGPEEGQARGWKKSGRRICLLQVKSNSNRQQVHAPGAWCCSRPPTVGAKPAPAPAWGTSETVAGARGERHRWRMRHMAHWCPGGRVALPWRWRLVACGSLVASRPASRQTIVAPTMHSCGASELAKRSEQCTLRPPRRTERTLARGVGAGRAGKPAVALLVGEFKFP